MSRRMILAVYLAMSSPVLNRFWARMRAAYSGLIPSQVPLCVLRSASTASMFLEYCEMFIHSLVRFNDYAYGTWRKSCGGRRSNPRRSFARYPGAGRRSLERHDIGAPRTSGDNVACDTPRMR